ncbi:hypothetical protein GBA52_010719 [Prunus armeniaca]|nr:hypothetical protein GBA52_010719 [Prunus armeniaca]
MLYRSSKECLATKSITLNHGNYGMSIWVLGEEGMKMVFGGIIHGVLSGPTRKCWVLYLGQFPNRHR